MLDCWSHSLSGEGKPLPSCASPLPGGKGFPLPCTLSWTHSTNFPAPGLVCPPCTLHCKLISETQFICYDEAKQKLMPSPVHFLPPLSAQFCQTLSVKRDHIDLFFWALLMYMTFLGTHQLHGGVYVFFTKCPLRNTLVSRYWYSVHPHVYYPAKKSLCLFAVDKECWLGMYCVWQK